MPSLLAALCGASACTITDHPSSPALTDGAIEKNVKLNLYGKSTESNDEEGGVARSDTDVQVYGYTWGTKTFYLPSSYGKPASPPPASALPADTALTASGYPCPDRIIVADCLWMPSQHLNIVRTILDFLPPKPPLTEATSTPCALVVAGFHTGRGIVRDFFAYATDHPSADQSNLNAEEQFLTNQLRLASIFEMDTSGNRRDWIWDTVREGEGKWEAKRWCVVGVLVRR